MIPVRVAGLVCAFGIAVLFASDAASEWERLTIEGRGLVAQARYGEAESRFRSAMAVLSAGTPEPERLGTTWNDIAVALRELGRAQEAEVAFTRAIELLRKAQSARSTQYAAMSNLAGLYKDMGRYRAADRLLRESLRECEAALSPTHRRCTTVLSNLADLLNSEGRFSQAAPLLRRAIAIEEAQFGEDDPHLAFLFDNLCFAYRGEGAFDAAEPLCRRALEFRLRDPGPNHPDTARTQSRLAGILAKLGHPEEATALAEQGLRTMVAALGPNDQQVAVVLYELALVYTEQGRYSDAESAFLRSIEIAGRMGENHPEHLRRLDTYADLLRLMHRKKEAARIEALVRRGLAFTDDDHLGGGTVTIDSLRRGR